MAEGSPPLGMGASDWLRTLVSGFFGGLPGLATSPAAQPLWDRGGEAAGMEGGQLKSLAGLLFAALSGGGLLPLATAGWGVAKKFAVPTQARWWDTPASPYGMDYGRSDLQGQEMGGPEYLAQPWSPGMQQASYNRGDVHVGPGSEYAVNSMVGDAESDFFGGRGGRFMDRMGGVGSKFGGVGPNGPLPGQPPPRPSWGPQFDQAREQLGMPLVPDFNQIRAMLGMGG